MKPTSDGKLSTASTTPESPTVMFSLFKKLSQYHKYRNTVEQVRRGERLYEMSSDELKRSEFMGPYTLNIYESFLAALPSGLLFGFLNFLFPPVKETIEASIVAAEGARIGGTITSVVQPLLIPFVFMYLAWVASWSSLHKRDSNKVTRKRAKFAFLYFDGSYGLIPEGLFVFAISLWIFQVEHNVHGPVATGMIITAIIVFLITVVWNRHIVFNKIPSRLFEINGYSPKRPGSFQWFRRKPRDPNPGPWNKYDFALYIPGGCALLIFWFVIGILCGLLGLAIAHLKM